MRAPEFELWWVASHWTVLPLDYKPNRMANNDFMLVGNYYYFLPLKKLQLLDFFLFFWFITLIRHQVSLN
jgi:hypothetical protein